MMVSTGFSNGIGNKGANLDLLVKKRQWEQEKRGTLISADAS